MSRYQTMPPYQMCNKFSKAHFLPWIGSSFGSETSMVRILLLGESHYTEKHINADRTETVDHSRHIIQWGAVKRNERFYARVRNLILRGTGKPLVGYHDPKQRQQFWDSVAFYNYIQEFVGTKPKQRPKEQMWETSKAGFWEVLEKLKPDVCIVLGKELWAKLPRISDNPETSIELCTDESSGIRFMKILISGHQILCTPTPHPSSIGLFKKDKVVPVIKRILEIHDTTAVRV